MPDSENSSNTDSTSKGSDRASAQDSPASGSGSGSPSQSGSASGSEPGSRSRSGSESGSRSRSGSESGSRSRSGSEAGSRSASVVSGSSGSEDEGTIENTGIIIPTPVVLQSNSPKVVRSANLRYEIEHGYTALKPVKKSAKLPYIEKTKNKEFWLIHAPVDCDEKLLNGITVAENTTAVIGRKNTEEDSEEGIWQLQATKGVSVKESTMAVLLPSKKDGLLHAAGCLEGQLLLSCRMPLQQYTIPEDPYIAPKLPPGLKLRNTPFGSGDSAIQRHRSEPDSLKKKAHKRTHKPEMSTPEPHKHKKKKKTNK